MNASRRVFVTGMGVQSAAGMSLERFWEGLVMAKGCVRAWEDAPEEVKDARAALLLGRCEDGGVEGEKVDPLQARFSILAVRAARAAWADAGRETSGRMAVAMGSGLGSVPDLLDSQQRLENRGSRRVSPYFIARVLPNMAAANVARVIQQESENVDLSIEACWAPATACSASAHAIGEAAAYLRAGYADLAIAGGSDACISPLTFAGFAACRALATNAKGALPFHKERTGFVLGEGAACLVLEASESVPERAYAEIVGFGQSCDAAIHLVTPPEDGRGIAKAMRSALTSWNASETQFRVVHCNAHATGTMLGDIAELRAIDRVVGDLHQRTVVTSIKGHIGHCLGAAGSVEAVCTVLSLASQCVPPVVGLNTPEDIDPDCARLDHVDIAMGSDPSWVVGGNDAIAISNSSGFGGSNVSLAFKTVPLSETRVSFVDSLQPSR